MYEEPVEELLGQLPFANFDADVFIRPVHLQELNASLNPPMEYKTFAKIFYITISEVMCPLDMNSV